jgi:NitT/TauT family transport system ATP-binding protein
VGITQVTGLLEIVADHGGDMDVFALSQLTDYDFDRTIAVVKAGEILDFLDTPRNRAALTNFGRSYLAGDQNARKSLLHHQLRELPTFRFVSDLLGRAPEGRLAAEQVKEELAARLPTEPVEPLFKTIVGWGRYAEFLGFNASSGELYLDQGAGAAAGSQGEGT